MTATTLDKLVPGESGRIVKLGGKGAVRRRLLDMGLTSGAQIDMVKTSPLGDPVEYRLRGYHLSLRKSEAKTIEVELFNTAVPLRSRRQHAGSVMPLGNCLSGQQAVIFQTRGGKRIHSSLDALDLGPGMSVQVVQNEFLGPMIISVNDERRVEIGKGLARHIMVKPI
jgi:ferrous iron transport protein A